MIKLSKNICFKIAGSHHTLKIIVICKTFVVSEPIYRSCSGIYPVSPDFKAFSLSISLSKVGAKNKEEGNYEGIRLLVLFDVFHIFYLILLKTFLK